MQLFFLLLIPVCIGLVGFLLSLLKGHGEITWKEFIAHVVITLVLIGVGYAIARHYQTADTEIWNGRIARKWEGTGSCCHSYPCNPHSCNCDSKGNCSTCYDTCYQHSHDITWNADTTNGETAYYDGCNAPGSGSPARWDNIVVGEPTAIEHSYTNYIKGNPDSVLRHSGVAERFGDAFPAYPPVFDHYRANRLVTVGVNVPNARALNARLAEINADLGRRKEVNIVMIVTNQGDQMYLEALKEAWIGGKKNDLVVVIGAPAFPEIAWAGVMSWTRVEELKISIRDRIMERHTFDENTLGIVGEEVRQKFVRRNMQDFEYLAATVQPPEWAFWLLLFLGIFISIGLQIYFYRADPFGDEQRFLSMGSRRGRRRF